MPFEIHQGVSQVTAFKADRRLYLTGDKSRVVEEGDTSSAWLFAAPGSDISQADVKAYGLRVEGGKIVLPGAAGDPGEPKEREKSEDKAVKKVSNKTAKKK